jgi:hypothetical protein
LSLVACLLFVLVVAPCVSAQTQDQIEANGDPVLREFKGVHLGMPANEARKLLGSPADKSDQQDLFSPSDKETIQVSYDAQHNVAAIAVMYLGGDKAPACKDILGSDLTAKPDGSMYRLVRYPKAGYWVSYSRTPGDSPLITVMMQKYKP